MKREQFIFAHIRRIASSSCSTIPNAFQIKKFKLTFENPANIKPRIVRVRCILQTRIFIIFYTNSNRINNR